LRHDGLRPWKDASETAGIAESNAAKAGIAIYIEPSIHSVCRCQRVCVKCTGSSELDVSAYCDSLGLMAEKRRTEYARGRKSEECF
jgi:hypothetical protein